MKIFQIVILFLTYLSINISAQNLTKIFKSYLPKIVFENNDFQEQINASLNYYAVLNPEFIYLYIKYLDARFNKNILDLDSNYYNYLLDKEKELVRERNNWVHLKINEACELTHSLIDSWRVTSYYNDFYHERQDSKPIKIVSDIDIKLQDYFIYIYLSNETVIYDSSIAYKSMIETEINQLINYVSLGYQNADSLSNTDKDQVLQIAMDYPFILKNYYKNIFNKTTDFELYQLIDLFYSEKYWIDTEFLLSGMYQLFSIRSENEVFSPKMERFPFHVLPIWNINFTARSNFLIGIGCKIKLSDERRYLSYIRFGLQAGLWALFEEHTNIPNQRRLDTYYIGHKRYIGNIYSDNANTSNKEYLNLSISLPTVYLFKDFQLEFGINYFHFKFNYSKSIRRDTDPEIFFSDDSLDYNTSPITRSFSTSLDKFWPFISINYSIYGTAILKAIATPHSWDLGIDFIVFKF